MPFSFFSAAKLWELGTIGALALALFVGSWYGSKAHYAALYARFEGGVQAEAAAQGAQFKAQAESHQTVTKEVEDVAAKDVQIQSMAAALSDLSVRLGAAAARGGSVPAGGDVRTPAPRPEPASDEPAGRAASASPGFTPDDCRAAYGGYEPADLRDALQVGLGALDELLLFRQYARDTGQGHGTIAPDLLAPSKDPAR